MPDGRPVVLIVDDQPVNLRLLAEILNRDYAVKVATSGQDALTLSRRRPYPDLILLDVMMPEMDGFEVCEALRQHPVTASTPVIFVTARSDPRSESEGLSRGAVDFISKPIDRTLVRLRVDLHIRLRQREAALRDSKQRLEIALDAGAMGIWDYRIQTGMLTWTRQHAALLGLGATCDGMSLTDLRRLIYPQDQRACLRNLHRTLTRGVPFDQIFRVVWADGAVHWLHSLGQLTRDEHQEAHHVIGTSRDICALKLHQEQLECMAHSDALTALPNRIRLRERLREAMAGANRSGRRLALVYLDLDGFKAINDAHGHAVGDRFLVAIARRLQGCLREVDTLGRLGGDEFAAVLVDLPGDNGYQPLIERLLRAAANPAFVDGYELCVTASLGVAFYPQALPVTPDELLSQADMAMYQAKQDGKNRYRLARADRPDQAEKS